MNQQLSYSDPARQSSATVSPHGHHGGRVFQTARALGISPDALLDVSNNANSLAADLTTDILAAIRPEHRFYPDPACAALREALTTAEGLPSTQILPVHGSAEGILLALLARNPAQVCIVGPIFSEYPRWCEVLGIPWRLHALRPETGFALTAEDRQALQAAPEGMVILCSPNNPAGCVIPDLPGLLAALAPREVIVDLAYKDFLHGEPAFAGHVPAVLLQANPHTICLTSMTKFFFCPGIRLGCVLAGPATIARLAALQPPWSVTQTAQDAGVAFLDQQDAYRARLAELRRLREDFAGLLCRTPGVAEVLPSDVNFLLVRLDPGCCAASLAESLACEQHILVRVCDTIPGMPPGYVRLQVRTAEENARVAQALAICASK
ncbi:pyridoxal phosphate-dependent aminotransferase [Megalodesulfovibrio paquesii]